MYKVGNRIISIKGLHSGQEGVVSSICDGISIKYDNGDSGYEKNNPEQYYKIISCGEQNKPCAKKMSLISKLMLQLKSEPEKSFIKAGVTNADGTLTCEGKELYENWRFQQDAAQFNTDVVQPLLAQMKEEKDCAK